MSFRISKYHLGFVDLFLSGLAFTLAFGKTMPPWLTWLMIVSGAVLFGIGVKRIARGKA